MPADVKQNKQNKKTKQNMESVLMIGFTMQLKRGYFGLAGPAALSETSSSERAVRKCDVSFGRNSLSSPAFLQ